MKIEYLGTAAFEGVPALFCGCEVCKRARASGGKNIRSRSQALVNDELLLDFNADTCMHFQRYGLDPVNVRACLITHSHCDHLYTDDIEAAGEPFSHGHGRFRFFAPGDSCAKIKAVADKTNGGAEVFAVESGKKFCIDGKYEVLPLRANHDKDIDCVFYSIACDGKRLLYAHDTGVFFDDVWELLKSEGRFDLVSLDCTGCLGLNGEWRNGHMSLKTNAEVVERMKDMGIVDGNTRVVLNHFSHNGGQIYDEMIHAAKQYGFTVSYDGAVFEF